MASLRSLTSALLATALLALAGCGGGGQETAPEVAQAPPARIEIAPATVLLTAPGARKSLSAKVFDAAGNPLTTAVEWTSSRPAQVTVDAAGVVTAAGTGGSSQVTARIGTLASAPLLVVHTTVPAGTVLVNDANITGDLVETDPDALPAVGATYVARLVGVTAPRVGELLMNTESKPVAGRVTAVESANGEHRVTLALVTGPEMFPNLSLDEAIDLNQAEVEIPVALRDQYDIQRAGNTFTFTPKPGQFTLAGGTPSDRKTIASAPRARPLATATPVGTAALPPFTNCEATLLGAGGAAGLPVGLSVPPQFTFALNNRLDVKYSSATGLERFVIHGEPNFTVNGGLKALVAFEGKVTCEVELLVIRIPVGGPLSLIIGGLVPVGVGAELAGKVTVASMGISTNVVGKTVFDVGIACPGGGDCSLVNTFGPVDIKPVPVIDVPSIGDLRLEPSLSIYAFVKASVGNPFLKKLRFDALSVKVGAAARASFAPMSTQIADPIYKSDYKLLTELRAGAGTQLSGLAAMLGLRAISFVDLQLNSTFASSPLGAVAADKPAFVRGDTVNFKVTLDSTKVEFPPALGPYNVRQIVLVRRIDLTTQQEVARVTAASGQTEFNMPFIAENTGRADEFFAFVVTALAPVDFLALELGQATAPLGQTELRGSVALNSTTTTRTSRDGSTSETVVTVNVNGPVRYDAARSGLVLLQAGFTGSEVRESRSVTEIDRSPCIFDSVIETVERTTITPRGPEFGSIDFRLAGDSWVLGDPTLPVTKQKTTTTRQSATNARGDCSRTDLSTTTRVEEFPPQSSVFDPPLSLSLTSTPVFSGSLSRDAQGLRSLTFADSLTQSDERFTPPRLLETTVQITLRDQPAP